MRDRKVHEEVVRDVTGMAAGLGFEILGLDYSPIRGPEGNIEYLMYIRKPQEADGFVVCGRSDDGAAEAAGSAGAAGAAGARTFAPVSEDRIRELVAASHEQLDRV